MYFIRDPTILSSTVRGTAQASLIPLVIVSIFDQTHFTYIFKGERDVQ